MDAFVVTFREGIEAVLVIGITVAFLRKSGRGELVKLVFFGAGAAIVFSAAAALALQSVGVTADNPVPEAILHLLAAVAVLTMVIWMLRTGRRMREGIESRVGGMLGKERSAWAIGLGLFALAFFVVAREGVEVILSWPRSPSAGRRTRSCCSAPSRDSRSRSDTASCSCAGARGSTFDCSSRSRPAC